MAVDIISARPRPTAADADAAPPRTGALPPRGRIAALDGLRGVAVLLVLAYHAGLPVRGGLLGVDVFFVLSGYLITSLLLGEHRRTGTVRFGAFWGRRARRLLPGLAVLLFGAAAYTWTFRYQLDITKLRGDILSTLLYFSNWHFAFSGQGYFAQGLPPSPLLHTWSLAIEEQYYLLWPLVVWLVLRWRGPKALARLCALGVTASAATMAALYLSGAAVDRVYYGTDTRAQDLLLGSLLAVIVATWPRAADRLCGADRTRLGIGAWLGTVAVVVATLWMSVWVPGTSALLYQGLFLAFSVGAGWLVLVVTRRPATPGARALAHPTIRYVGRISYGLYLYHWPLFLLIDHIHAGLSGATLLAVRLGATFACAVASFHLIEEPIRRGRLLRGAGRPVALVTAGALVVATTLIVTRPPNSQEQVASAFAGQPHPSADASNLAAQPVRAMLFGDSIAFTLGAGLNDHSTRWGVRFDVGPPSNMSVALGCDLVSQGTVEVDDSLMPVPPACADWPRRWTALVDRYTPQVAVVEVGRWEIANRVFHGQWTHIGKSLWDSYLTTQLDRVVDTLSSRGASVVFLTMPYIEPMAESLGGRVLPENDPRRVDAFNRLLAGVVRAHPGTARLIDLNRMLDPKGRFTPTQDGIVLREPDGVHITVAGGVWLQPSLLTQIRALGLTERTST